MYRRERSLLMRQAIAGLASLAGFFVTAGLAQARPGDIIVGDSSAAKVYRLDPGTGAKTVISDDPQLASPNDSVFGPDGTLYVADYEAFGGLGGAFEINPRTGATSELAGGAPFSQPDGIARNPSGSLFETDLSAGPFGGFFGALFRVGVPGGGVGLIAPASGGPALDDPQGVVVPPSGKPIVGTNAPSIVQINPRTGAQHVIANATDGLTQSGGLARAPDGTLYTPASPSGIDSVNPRTGEVQRVSSVPTGGYGLAIDFRGNVVTQSGTDVFLANPRTGSFRTIGQGFVYAEGFEVEPPRCGGRTATIVGTTRKEGLRGSNFADVIAGLDGNDKINALGSNDRICAGKGRDTINVRGLGLDRVSCGPGDDLVRASRTDRVGSSCEVVKRR